MNHINLKVKTYLLMGFCISMGLLSCQDEQDDLGVSIHPDNERLLVRNDTVKNYKIYSVGTPQLISVTSGAALLGSINDPLIGGYKSSFIANARPRVLSMVFADSLVLDSMFLYIKYDTVFGDYNYEHSYSVYEMLRDSALLVEDLQGEPDDISSLSGYYNVDDLLGVGTYTPEVRLDDSVIIAPIKLDLLQTEKGLALADRILFSPDSLYSYLPYVQQNIFNGLFVEAETRTEAGGIISVLGSDSTRLSIYYTEYQYDSTDNQYDTVSQYLNFDLYSLGRANVYERSQNPDLPIFDTATEPEIGQIDSTFYLHGINGIEGRLVIDDFSSFFPDSTPIAVNRALISIQVEDSAFLQADTYTVMPSIYIYADDDSDPYLSEFIAVDGSGNLSYIPVAYANGKYTFAVTSRIVKAHNQGLDKFGFKILPNNNHTNPSRVALKGMGNEVFPIKFDITYTIINSD